MTKSSFALIVSFLVICVTLTTTQAKVSPQEAAKLGQELTPLGAIQEGNKEGTIPPWTDGITKPPSCYIPRTFHCDPFSNDQRLPTITAENVNQYAKNLSPGQVAVFRRYPDTWRMPVYPTRRSAAFPQHVYDRAIANATRAELADEGDGVLNAIGGVPFPIPTQGVEAIWNHVFKYKGETVDQITGQVAPTANGSYTFVRLEQKLYSLYQQQGATPESIGNILHYFLQRVDAPARLAGRILLVHEPINQVKQSRQAWVYNPGQRRVRRAPHVAYDNPGTAADAQRTTDQNDMWNASPDRYNWTLIGRREMYVPYNSYQVHSGNLKYDDILMKGHINPDLLRYELHRVWVVEATLKKGLRHIYARRTFYLDEDSWQVLAVDQYDNDQYDPDKCKKAVSEGGPYDRCGKIWRVSEAHVINYYEVPLLFPTLEVHYDLQNGRYLAMGLNNQERPEIFNPKMNKLDFTENALRRKGRR